MILAITTPVDQVMLKEYYQWTSGGVENFSGEQIVFKEDQINRLAEDYNAYPRYEVAYCLNIKGDNVVGMSTANIRTSSPQDVIFNCPEDAGGWVHLHPNKNPYPSDLDKEQLKNAEDIDISCIYGLDFTCWAVKDDGVKRVKIFTGG